MEIKKTILTLAFVLFTSSCFSSIVNAEQPFKNICTPGTTCKAQITWQGKLRTYFYHLPPMYSEQQRYMPLVIALHSSNSNGLELENAVMKYSFDKLSDRNRFIVIYPNAYDGFWNDGRTLSNTTDDVGFLRALINYFNDHYHTNPNRIYVTGISSGGFMAQYFACESADNVTAVGVVASSMPITLAKTCNPSRHIPILLINGTEDPILPWNSRNIIGFQGESLGVNLTVLQTFHQWRSINDIHSVPLYSPVATKYDGTYVWKASSIGKDGSQVILYVVFGGGHTWPGGGQYQPIHYIGKLSTTFNATEILWQFFISNRLKPLEASTK